MRKRREMEERERIEQDRAATKIGAVYRGRKARKEVSKIKG
mgnify:CR=1 FL=1